MSALFSRLFSRLLLTTLTGLSLLFSVAGLADSGPSPRAAILLDDMTALSVRINMIREAKESINFSTFEWEPDEVGLIQLKLLAEAAQRGVKVNVIIDGYGGKKIPLGMLRYLKDSGADVRMYHPLSLRKLKRSNRRMHDKYLGVDGIRVLMGGRNATSGFFEIAHKDLENRDDAEVLLEGAGTRTGEQVYEELFKSSDVEAVPGIDHLSAKARAESVKVLNAITNKQIDSLVKGAHEVKMLRVDGFDISGDPREVMDVSGGVWKTLTEVLRRSNDKVLIVSPYGAFTDEQKSEILALRKSKVTVEVVTNSTRTMGSAANEAIAAAYSKQVAWLDSIGVHVYEHDGPFMLHKKAIVRDQGAETCFQSFNMGDERSQKLNSEIMVTIRANSPETQEWRESVNQFANLVRAQAKLVTTKAPEKNPFFEQCFRGKVLRLLVRSKAIRSVL